MFAKTWRKINMATGNVVLFRITTASNVETHVVLGPR